MRANNPKKTLRRRLFGSHLLVIAVALAVVVIIVGGLGLAGETRSSSPDRRDDSGPLVPLVGLAVAAVSAGLVSWRSARQLAEPLEAVGAATRDLAAGRYSTLVPESDVFELDSLASDVNQLARDLETTEQRRLRLIGDVAHELRNPLTTIEGTMEALLDGVIPADDETHARIGREASRLRRLADDLSSLSAAGELEIVGHDLVDLASVTSDVVSQLEPQAAAKGLRLTVDTPPLVEIRGDRDRLVQVLMNVVGNAVQYTDAGDVSVHVTSANGTTSVTVRDTGRGLAEPDVVRVFERFHRIDEQFTDGTGVGLAIAKLIVEAHSGRIFARSDGLGSGSIFHIELPTAS